MAAESVLNKADRLLGKPIPNTFDECIANLRELGNFYLNEFRQHRFSRNVTEDEAKKMDDRLVLITTKLREFTDKLTQLQGGSRKRATRKLRRKRRF